MKVPRHAVAKVEWWRCRNPSANVTFQGGPAVVRIAGDIEGMRPRIAEVQLKLRATSADRR